MQQYGFEGQEEILTPSLVYYLDYIVENTQEVIKMTKGVERLWPHVKTHKMREMVKYQVSLGIDKFKCATLSELDMVAHCGAKSILLAYPIIGETIKKYSELILKYPSIEFFAIADNEKALDQMSDMAIEKNITINLLADVNTGLDRTGIDFDSVCSFAKLITCKRGLSFRGLHIYDGQLHMESLSERMEAVASIDNKAKSIVDELSADGFSDLIVIAGGSGTTACHAICSDFYLSPGTIFINDKGYSDIFKDIRCIPAGVVLTSVISHPKKGYFTLDLGYKAIGAEMDGAPGYLLDINAQPVFQNEEHWVWKMNEDSVEACPEIGSILYVIPTHICTTTNLYSDVLIVSNGKVIDRWKTVAHERYF